MNVVVVWGVLSRAPERRVLPSGDEAVSFDVTVRSVDGPAESVPVSWLNPPKRAGVLAEGSEVVVTGRVRRRFFRSGGATASRTEVVAEHVVPARQRRRRDTVLEQARAVLVEADPSG